MKEEKKLSPEMEERIKEVKLDNIEENGSSEGVSCDKVSSDTTMINPDMETLDRG